MQSRSIVGIVACALALTACGGGGSPGMPAGQTSLSIAGLPASGPLSANATYQVSAVEVINGVPTPPGPLAVTLDNPAVGTLAGSTLVAGIVNATGNLTVKDAAHALSATISVRVGTPHPSATGDAFTFAGTIAQTITRPMPAPVATAPPFLSSAAVAITTTVVGTNATYAGVKGLDDFRSVEADTTQSPVITTTTTTDAYEAILPSMGLYGVLTPGFQASDSNGNVFQTVDGTGNGLLDVLPEQSGQTFTNTAALAYGERDADGTTLLRTDNQDGSYSETDTFADGTSQTIVVNADLSGSVATVRGSAANITIGAPSAGTSSTIAIAQTAPLPQNLTLPTWYPSRTLASDTFVTTTGQTIPNGCVPAAGIGTSATSIVETYLRLDPTLGTYENRTTTNYLAPSYGLACSVIDDRLDDYYEYSRQLGGVVQFFSTPVQTTVTLETIALKSATVAGAPKIASVARGTSAAAVASAAAMPAIGARAFAVAKASFERVIGHAYAARRRHLHDALAATRALQESR